nr:hypothetical protein [uncultured Dyadobacter sp.]
MINPHLTRAMHHQYLELQPDYQNLDPMTNAGSQANTTQLIYR